MTEIKWLVAIGFLLAEKNIPVYELNKIGVYLKTKDVLELQNYYRFFNYL